MLHVLLSFCRCSQSGAMADGDSSLSRCELADVLSLTSASGVARLLYINRAWGDGCSGVALRAHMTLLLLLPLSLGIAEVTLASLRGGGGGGGASLASPCPAPLPLWLAVDGSAALATAALSLVDIARVVDAAGAAARGAAAGGAEDGLDDDGPHARRNRARSLGTYACLGALIIFVIPLFRLAWLLYGLDLVYRVDTAALSSFFAPPSALLPGPCDATLFAFLVYYCEVATLIILAVLAVLLLLLLVAAVSQGGRVVPCGRCGGGEKEAEEAEDLIPKR